MNRYLKLAVGAAAMVALSGCYYYGDRYGYDRYGYNGWYDGYYGAYGGGYWGPDGYFTYYDADRHPHRDYDRHFRHDRFEGATEFRAEREARDRDYRDRDYDRDDYRR